MKLYTGGSGSSEGSTRAPSRADEGGVLPQHACSDEGILPQQDAIDLGRISYGWVLLHSPPAACVCASAKLITLLCPAPVHPWCVGAGARRSAARGPGAPH